MFKLYCTKLDTQEPVILSYDAKENILLDENGVDLGEEFRKKFEENLV